MHRTAVARWTIALCLFGQLVLSLAAGGNICFSCGPTYCNGIEFPTPAPEPACCCDRCTKEAPTPEHKQPRKCCCGEAVPMPHEHRRAEVVASHDQHRFIIEPIALDPFTPALVADRVHRFSLHTGASPPPRRTSDGIASTRLLI